MAETIDISDLAQHNAVVNAEPKYKAEDFFIVAQPTRNGYTHTYTTNVIHTLASELDKYFVTTTSDMPLTWCARNQCIGKLVRDLDKDGIAHGDYVRLLWWDADIHILDDPKHVYETFKYAEANNLNLIGNYKQVWTDSILMNMICIPDSNGDLRWIKNTELAVLNNYDLLPEGSAGGLGFAYINMPLDYQFHSDPTDKGKGILGEDINMFKEIQKKDPNWRLSYTDIQLGHNKNLILK